MKGLIKAGTGVAFLAKNKESGYLLENKPANGIPMLYNY